MAHWEDERKEEPAALEVGKSLMLPEKLLGSLFLHQLWQRYGFIKQLIPCRAALSASHPYHTSPINVHKSNSETLRLQRGQRREGGGKKSNKQKTVTSERYKKKLLKYLAVGEITLQNIQSNFCTREVTKVIQV